MSTGTFNTVPLFFNLHPDARPGDYKTTSTTDVNNFIDEGVDPVNPKLSEFVKKYWETVSYGKLKMGLKVSVDNQNSPLIPQIRPKGDNAEDWIDIIRKIISVNGEQIWEAGGKKMLGRLRYIPSVFLVQNYGRGASATFRGLETYGPAYWNVFSVDFRYRIGDVHQIRFSLAKTSPSDLPELVTHGRKFWGTLIHEFAHNFLEFWDLYGPQGTTGYWDLLGDNTPAGRMSEISSVFKERIGWLRFKNVIQGPSFPKRTFSLRPYTTSGDAIKIIPDPLNNPHEYFVLEYRKSTGKELWRPDGALSQEGLLITHFNTRLGVSPLWLMREAPYFDPEFADYSDKGAAQWTGHDKLDGVLFPQGGNNAFTRSSKPNSNFYGNRASGLSITNIRLTPGRCRFHLEIAQETNVGWYTGPSDIAVAGKFIGKNNKHSLFMMNENYAATLAMADNKWFVNRSTRNWIGNWRITGQERPPLTGDFDGDGKDELYFRNDDQAAIIDIGNIWWESKGLNTGWIDGWNLGKNDWEIVANIDGDIKDEIIIRSAEWMGVLKYVVQQGIGNIKLLFIKHKNIGRWNFSSKDKMLAGYFRNIDRQDIFIANDDNIGLFTWDNRTKKLGLRTFQHDRIGEWNIGPKDKFYVGDFDGDGLDEIYVRSAQWCGLMKYSARGFRTLGLQYLKVQPHSHNIFIEGFNRPKELRLRSTDKSYIGRFVYGRDCILNRGKDKLSIIFWNGSGFKVRTCLTSKFNGHWSLNNQDKFVIGDFHVAERDTADPSQDYVGNRISDVFIHNSRATGTVAANYLVKSIDNHDREELGIIWVQDAKILRFQPWI